MTLHSRATLAAKVETVLSGAAEPATDLECFAVLRAIDEGQTPRITYDLPDAIKRGADLALQLQAAAAAPAGVKANPALCQAWAQASAKNRREKPPIEGLQPVHINQLPKPQDPADAVEMRGYYSREIMLEPQIHPSERDVAARIRQLPYGNDERQRLLEEKVGRGDFGRLGKLLDLYSADDQARLQVVDRAQAMGCFHKLGVIRPMRVDSRIRGVFARLMPAIVRNTPHSQAVGVELVYAGETKNGDQPPKELAEGLGTWAHVEVADLIHGAWKFVPASAQKAAAAE
jgi:hypothetical protein